MTTSEIKRFGHYECDCCGRRWKSAYTFCDIYSNEPKYPQDCQRCDTQVFAHDVDPLKCKESQDNDHDVTKQHRQDLCHRCKDKPYPCSENLSFNVNHDHNSEDYDEYGDAWIGLNLE